MRSGLSLTGFPQDLVPANAMRHAFGLLSQLIRFRFEAVLRIVRCETFPGLHLRSFPVAEGGSATGVLITDVSRVPGCDERLTHACRVEFCPIVDTAQNRPLLISNQAKDDE
jgi:hypothetical protein